MLLEILDLSRSTYYYQLKQLNKGEKGKALKAEIKSIYDEYKGNYGYRRIHLEWRHRGFMINHKKVQRLMKVMGLAARIRWKRKYSSYMGEVGKKADNLIQRQFKGSKPYEKCYTDVTEFTLPNTEGKLYLSPVLDGYNSEIIAFTLSRSPNLKQVQTMLEKHFQMSLKKPLSFTVIKAGNINMIVIIVSLILREFSSLCLEKGIAQTMVWWNHFLAFLNLRCSTDLKGYINH